MAIKCRRWLFYRVKCIIYSGGLGTLNQCVAFAIQSIINKASKHCSLGYNTAWGNSFMNISYDWALWSKFIMLSYWAPGRRGRRLHHLKKLIPVVLLLATANPFPTCRSVMDCQRWLRTFWWLYTVSVSGHTLAENWVWKGLLRITELVPPPPHSTLRC